MSKVDTLLEVGIPLTLATGLIGGAGYLIVEDATRESPANPCKDVPAIVYEDVVEDLPLQVVVDAEGNILDQKGDPVESMGELSFPGLEALAEDREKIFNAGNYEELGAISDELFAPYGFKVFFGPDADYPDVIREHVDYVAEYYEVEETVVDWAAQEEDLELVKSNLDQLLLDTTFQPMEYLQNSIGPHREDFDALDTVSLMRKWTAGGRQHDDSFYEDGEYVTQKHTSIMLSWHDRNRMSGVDAHEKAHAFDDRACHRIGRQAIGSLNPEGTPRGYDKRFFIEEAGVYVFDTDVFVSDYAASDGVVEEYAELTEDLRNNGLDVNYSPENRSPLNDKSLEVARHHEIFAPGSADFMAAQGIGRLCFDVELGDVEYSQTHSMPQEGLICDDSAYGFSVDDLHVENLQSPGSGS